MLQCAATESSEETIMTRFIRLLLPLLLLSPALQAAFFPAPLIDADWLIEHRDGVVILDVRKKENFDKTGYIEGAIPVDVGTVRVNRVVDGKELTRMRPTAEQFQTYLRRLGIDSDDRVVITQPGHKPGQLAGAARLYWHFKFYGFGDVALLDGGNAAWVDALEDLTDSPAHPMKPGTYKVGAEHPEILATMPQVRAALKRKGITLIDTRNLRYHIGIDKKSYVYDYGHIPGAKLLPYKFLTPAKGTQRYFKPERLHRIIGDLNIDLDDELILFCNSAYECSSVWFALHEVLGQPKVRIYDGSLHQWTQYEDNPMQTRVVF